jgi:hypothetical protein
MPIAFSCPCGQGFTVDGDKAGVRVNANNTMAVKVEPPTAGLFADELVEPNIIGRLRFAHNPTGEWALLLVTRPDARAAIRSFRKVFGRVEVGVELRIKKDRPEGGSSSIPRGRAPGPPRGPHLVTLSRTLRAACSVFFPSRFDSTTNGWSTGFTHGSA